MREPDLPKLPPVDPAAAAATLGGTLSPVLLAGLLADGDEELATWALSHSVAEVGRPGTYDTLVAGAMALVGTRWRSGQWSIAEEHLASQTLIWALERVRPTVGPQGHVGPQAVLAAVSGEHHMIGLVCLDQLLEEAGWSVANLGADVPATDLALFVARHQARLVALTASEMVDLESVIEAIAAVRAAHAGAEPLALMIGGRLASKPGLAATLGVDWAGTTTRWSQRSRTRCATRRRTSSHRDGERHVRRCGAVLECVHTRALSQRSPSKIRVLLR